MNMIIENIRIDIGVSAFWTLCQQNISWWTSHTHTGKRHTHTHTLVRSFDRQRRCRLCWVLCTFSLLSDTYVRSSLHGKMIQSAEPSINGKLYYIDCRQYRIVWYELVNLLRSMPFNFHLIFVCFITCHCYSLSLSLFHIVCFESEQEGEGCMLWSIDCFM